MAVSEELHNMNSIPVLALPKECSACSACAAICPRKAISLQVDPEGFYQPVINAALCCNCRKCTSVCPVLQKLEPVSCVKCYAGRVARPDILMQGSSGGIFPLLARYVIERKGIVYGAAYDAGKYSAEHRRVAELSSLPDLYGSKYVQSFSGECFIRVMEDLSAGRVVLFCGTPCQIAGLNQLVKKNRDNLILVDFICHGVPSPKVLKKYLLQLENKFNSRIASMSFRSKRSGWQNYSVVVKFQDGQEFVSQIRDNIYLKGFISNLYLRRSCCACHFHGKDSGSDITIGDFWGGKEKFPQWNDDKGISAMMVHTARGADLLDKMVDVDLVETTFPDIAKDNPSLFYSSPEHPNRKRFFRRIDQTEEIESLTETLLTLNFHQRLIKKLLSLLPHENRNIHTSSQK